MSLTSKSTPACIALCCVMHIPKLQPEIANGMRTSRVDVSNYGSMFIGLRFGALRALAMETVASRKLNYWSYRSSSDRRALRGAGEVAWVCIADAGVPGPAPFALASGRSELCVSFGKISPPGVTVESIT